MKLALERILRCSRRGKNFCRYVDAYGRSSPSLRLRPSSRDTWYALLVPRMPPLCRRRVAWRGLLGQGCLVRVAWAGLLGQGCLARVAWSGRATEVRQAAAIDLREHKCHSRLNLQQPTRRNMLRFCRCNNPQKVVKYGNYFVVQFEHRLASLFPSLKHLEVAHFLNSNGRPLPKSLPTAEKRRLTRLQSSLQLKPTIWRSNPFSGRRDFNCQSVQL